jgi:serine/threonine-protein kinase
VDTEDGTLLTIRTMHIADDADLEAFVRFQQEGTLLTQLRHPNIWRIYSTFLDEQLCCIVSERVDGRPLSEILPLGQMELSRVKVIARQVASALSYGHERGVIHREVNPGNIVVTADDRVKLRAMSELGIARLLRGGGTISITSGLDSMAALYSAPEQIEERPVDHRVDVYSLGAVMYQMVTGRPPFEGKNVMTIAAQHVRETPLPPSRLRADLPWEWDALILKALAKDPVRRFGTAHALEEAIAELPVPGQSSEPSQQTADSALADVSSGLRRCPRCGRESRGAFCGSCGTKLVTT